MLANNAHFRVLGEKWFDNYVKMNNDSSEITRSVQKRDALYIDMLKDLGSEEIDIQCKIHILLLLQENASILVPCVKEIQEVVLSLKELFNSREKHLLDQKFKCHLMASTVTILISHESMEEKASSSLFRLMVEMKDFLIQIINTEKREKVLCSMACKCLEELERFFPGLLVSEADTVFATCQSQNSAVFQSYASLLSLIISNAVQMKSLVKKPFREQEEKPHGNMLQYSRAASCSELDILPIVIFMMDCVPFMSPMTAYHIMKHLVEIITDTPDLLPMTFKAYVPRLILTSDIPLFHLSFFMHKAFGSDLFTIQEEQTLLYQLVSLCCHPGLTVSHRLLFMEWISNCLDKKDQKYSRWNLTTEQLQSFAVGPFDGPDTMEKKLKLIATFTSQNQLSLLPVNTLQRFVKPILNIRGSSSLFRTLFAYIDLHFNTVLMDKIHRFLLTLIETLPHLTHHILDLLQCVRLHHPTSTLPEEAMHNLVEIVTTMPLESAKTNLELYLLILMKASTEKPEICNPKVILLFLKFILQNIPQAEDWLLGNSILAVCCALLQHQNVDIFYSDIGAILFMMMKYKDVDIRIQAKIYYGILTSLSSKKIQKVFQGHKEYVDTGHCFNNIATGNPSFHSAHPIQHLQTQILKLSRPANLIQNESLFLEDMYVEDTKYNFSEEIEGYEEERYQDFLSQADFISPVSFPICLQFVDEVEEKFQMLFGLLIKVNCSPPCGKIKNIEMPILSRSNMKLGRTDSIIYLDMYPEVPIPPHLEFRAEFTCQDGRSYQCEIPGISIQFEDLFLPLPVFPHAIDEAHHNFYRRQLFNTLWASFSNNADKRLSYSMCQQSAFNMKLDKDNLGFLMARWNKYRISNFPSSSQNRQCAFNVGIFIPKHCHILMKITSLKDFTVINIVTDDWKILPLLESYLTKLQSEDR